MIAAVREFANRFLGRGEATITVPSFDGALKPNQKLEAATTLLECEAPEDLATDGRNLYVAEKSQNLVLVFTDFATKMSGDTAPDMSCPDPSGVDRA